MRTGIATRLFVAAAFVVTLAHNTQAQAAPTPPNLGAKAVSTTRFLTPSSPSLFLPPDDARVTAACGFSDVRYQCPKFLKYGDTNAGPGPFIPPVFKADAPNLLVTFTLHDMKNVWVQNNGVDSSIHDVVLYFAVDSSASSAESPEDPSNPDVPSPFSAVHDVETSPGTTTNIDAVIWQALIIDGCNTPPPVIPIIFLNHASVDFEGAIFEATDNTSLTSTGFWNFEYTERANRTNGDERNWDVSDLTFRGYVSVVCTGLEELSD